MKLPIGFPPLFWFTMRFPVMVFQFVCSLHLTPLTSVDWGREEGRGVFTMSNEQL